MACNADVLPAPFGPVNTTRGDSPTSMSGNPLKLVTDSLVSIPETGPSPRGVATCAVPIIGVMMAVPFPDPKHVTLPCPLKWHRRSPLLATAGYIIKNMPTIKPLPGVDNIARASETIDRLVQSLHDAWWELPPGYDRKYLLRYHELVVELAAQANQANDYAQAHDEHKTWNGANAWCDAVQTAHRTAVALSDYPPAILSVAKAALEIVDATREELDKAVNTLYAAWEEAGAAAEQAQHALASNREW